MSTFTVCVRRFLSIIFPAPSEHSQQAPLLGMFFSSSIYPSCSYFKQHFNLSHIPEMLAGFKERSCSFAIFTFMESNFFRYLLQHRTCPHTPSPPSIAVSSLTPIWRSSILVFSICDSSLTSCLKSTLPSAVKMKRASFLS